MLTTTTDIPLQLCPLCGYEFEATTALKDGVRPGEGDFSVCVNCAVVMRYDANLRLVRSSINEASPALRAQLEIVVAGLKVMRERVELPGLKRQTRETKQ
jgi:hypothetical protein